MHHGNLHSFIENYTNILAHIKIDIEKYNSLEYNEAQILRLKIIQDEIMSNLRNKICLKFFFTAILNTDKTYSVVFTKIILIKILHHLLN